jgi:hypothetical protein
MAQNSVRPDLYWPPDHEHPHQHHYWGPTYQANSDIRALISQLLSLAATDQKLWHQLVNDPIGTVVGQGKDIDWDLFKQVMNVPQAQDWELIECIKTRVTYIQANPDVPLILPLKDEQAKAAAPTPQDLAGLECGCGIRTR